MPIFRKFIVVLMLLTSNSLLAAERPKIGLVLSGGGARGAAHIGVLRELEKQRIPIDYIVGTSIGAIVGGMYASGLGTDEIERVLVETDWDEMFRDRPPRKNTPFRRKYDDRLFQVNQGLGVKDGEIELPTGFIQGLKLQLLLEREFLPVTGAASFDQLPIPFRAVATNIITGKPAILESGSLATAVRASMSVPAIFATVDLNGQILVDGGISNNMPVDVAHELGADIVIAVDIGTPLKEAGGLVNVIGISGQLTNILVRRTTQEQIAKLGDRDILITPDLGSFSSADFAGASVLIEKGRDATVAESEKLQRLSLPEQTYTAHTEKRQQDKPDIPVISFIRIDNKTRLSEKYILSRIHQQNGTPLDLTTLEQDISIIYGLEIFGSVNYTLVEENNSTGLVIHVTPKPWGPSYLQLGLSLSSDLAETSDLGIKLGYISLPVNSWNAELRFILDLGTETGALAEFYQPLGPDSPYYVSTAAAYNNKQFNLYQQGEKVNQIQARTAKAEFALGREFGFSRDLRIGLNWSYSHNQEEFELGDTNVPDDEDAQFFVRYRIDALDDVFFPTSGYVGKLEWIKSEPGLGADYDYEQALFDVLGAYTSGKNTILLGARYFSTVDGVAPIANSFRVGGLFNLPGLAQNDLSGQNLYLIRSVYQRHLSNLFGTSPYLGATLQYGNVFDNSDDISESDGIIATGLWLGWETPIGPIYIGAGATDSNDRAIYIKIGSPY